MGDRIDDDIAAGRLWKARDRLTGHLRVDPANQPTLERLGDVYFRMGDLPQAGRAWFLTTREGPQWQAAEVAFYERYGKNPANVVAALRVGAAIDRFPAKVQERLRTLQRRLEVEGRFWEPKDQPSAAAAPTSLRSRLEAAASALVVALLLVALGVGLFNMDLFLIHAVSQ